MDFLDDSILDYCESHSQEETKLLHKVNRFTNQNVLKPRMLSGHLQGRFLALVSKLTQPKYILEIGTYTGYSAICLAEGLQKDGKLITIDNNEELFDDVSGFIKDAGYENKIENKIGNALEIIPQLNQNWDLVFIDADKENYIKYYDLIIPKLNAGGVVLIDNVLWSGKVLSPAKSNDESTKTIKILNKKISSDKRVENVLLPIRDGINVIRKKTD